MQKSLRINETQILHLAARARVENSLCGFLQKRKHGGESTPTVGGPRWKTRWFVLYKNLLFYFENDTNPKPFGVGLLEGCHCDPVVLPSTTAGGSTVGGGAGGVTGGSGVGGVGGGGSGGMLSSKGREQEKSYCFSISYDGQCLYDLRATSESDCTIWMSAVLQASFSKLMELKEQVEQKHVHLLQILDSERQAKWFYAQQTEELALEVKQLKAEIKEYRKEKRCLDSGGRSDVENEEIVKIKKVQSFFRGWLCRRRWKQIVELYIRSDHAESMRKRNSVVFGLVECEEEYVKQLSTLVAIFLRPLRMAASSKKPPITHEDVSSIFLNSETLLFLHQIFLKGLVARMENWPTLHLGDLFDMLLPMLGIYQEYVRNHHYSLQVLAEYKQKPEFNELLRRWEEKSQCEGHSLDTFLTYPMHQVPRYIITIHALLAHTAHDHVERKSLEYAKSKLENLSQIMQDEVSETENIRKNLSIERMIVQGCDILLDVEQTFVRQGSLIQVTLDKSKLGRLSSTFKESRKESVRQVFLFTHHMLLTTRATNGRLHLAKNFGKISLIDCTLIEDVSADASGFYIEEETCEGLSALSGSSNIHSSNFFSSPQAMSGSGTQSIDTASHPTGRTTGQQQQWMTAVQGTGLSQCTTDYNGLEFRIVIDARCGGGSTTSGSTTIVLMASTLQEKVAWCSDISQCIENLHYSDMLNFSLTDTSAVTLPHYMRSDPKLFSDSTDIKFSRSLNSCKVPQIRHASAEKLLDRLIDLRFLSIDFLNTFLLTYRVYTTGHTIVDALKRVYRNPESGFPDLSSSQLLPGSSFDTEDDSLPGSPPGPPPPPQGGLTRTSGGRTTTQTTDTFQMLASGYQHQQYQLSEQQRRISSISLPATDGRRAAGSSGAKLSLSAATTSRGRENVAQVPTETVQRDMIVREDLHPSAGRGGAGGVDNNSKYTRVESAIECGQDRNGNGFIRQTEQQQQLQQQQPPSGLSVPRTRLAPIASCETLSESLDLVGDDSTAEDEDDQSNSSSESSRFDTAAEWNAGVSADHETVQVSCGVGVLHEPKRVNKRNTSKMVALSACKHHGSETSLLDRNFTGKICGVRNGLPHTLTVPGGSKSLADASNDEMSEATSSDTLTASAPHSRSCSPALGAPVVIGNAGGGRRCAEDEEQATASSAATSTAKSTRKLSAPPPIGEVVDESGAGGREDCDADYRRASRDTMLSLANSPKQRRATSPSTMIASIKQCIPSSSGGSGPMASLYRRNESLPGMTSTMTGMPQAARAPSPISYNKRGSTAESEYTRCTPRSSCTPRTSCTPRSSCATSAESLQLSTKAGIVVTSSRASKRRSSSAAAAAAFAVATAGSTNLKEQAMSSNRFYSAASGDIKSPTSANKKRDSCSIISVANMRVLGVLKHWIAKHLQDFESNADLKDEVKELLEEMAFSSNLVAAEQRLALALLQVLNKQEDATKLDANLEQLLAQPPLSTAKKPKDMFDHLSALDIAEQMTFLDHQIFASIRSEELLSQAWMKADKANRASHVLLVSKRFNEASRLVVSEIMRRSNPIDRAACIEKWAAIADICRCFKNYNGVLQICAAFVNSSIFRLKKTWEKISKQSKQMIEKLQTLVSSDGRFKNMREALRRCDPPCIPYLGMYLTDLSFIEEGTPNITEDGLVNFSKMRMIAHVIREIQLCQSTPYKIECRRRVTEYLLDTSQLLEEDDTYRSSLEMEPRTARTSIGQLGGQLST